MIFGGIQRLSTIDFPGVLSCVVFTRGCDLDCFYCHNRTLISGQSEDDLSEEEVLAFLNKRVGKLSGVVVSGGEPTLWPELPEFLKKVRKRGFQIKLDSNGQRPAVLRALWEEGLFDYAAIDVKALPKDYAAVCGAPGFPQETVSTLMALGAPFEVRTTLYPGLTLDALKELFKLLPNMPRWRLNFFRMPQVYKAWDERRLHAPALTRGKIDEAKEQLFKLQSGLTY